MTRSLRVFALLVLSGVLAIPRLLLSPALPALPGWFAIPGLAAVSALAGGCTTVGELRHDPAPAGPAVPRPQLTRDFDRIRLDGTLRMVTRSSANSYFIHKGDDAGFEFELLRDFARSWNLKLEVLVVDSRADLISILNSGQADVAASGLDVDPEAARFAAFTQPCSLVKQVLVLRGDDPRPRSLEALNDLAVCAPAGSAAWRAVAELRDALGYRCTLVPSDPKLSAEALIARVARREIAATVAPENLARAVVPQLPGASLGPPLSQEQPVAWMVRDNSPDLLSALDLFLQGQFQVTQEGSRRSLAYGSLYDRYFVNPDPGVQTAADRPDLGGRLCRYDDLIRAVADSAGVDWRLVAAIIYAESRFDARAVSPTGAVGLMQVMPRCGRPSAARLLDPTVNVRAGVRYLMSVYQGFAGLDSLDRWRFTLATYHAGIGNVLEARDRAREAGRDARRWENGVAYGMLLLAKESLEGPGPAFHGVGTIEYVRRVIERHRRYCSVTPRLRVPGWRTPALPAGWAASAPLRPFTDPRGGTPALAARLAP
ncbi:MAG: MltF family protein [Candidatus Krumholzibacteriia bacterium]